ncbi:TIGR04197 family type VII secretion effector [Numidum massiliense]|uniref:TIGR04197 family type VII secretion effector n=1 Tax=Numidum massiliense TaxID=1522315 RepID=UPI0006D546CF|nr:TIGR04197 family type VII secretion effector [Numidum massiliense]
MTEITSNLRTLQHFTMKMEVGNRSMAHDAESEPLAPSPNTNVTANARMIEAYSDYVTLAGDFYSCMAADINRLKSIGDSFTEEDQRASQSFQRHPLSVE